MKLSNCWQNSSLMWDRLAIPSNDFGGLYSWWCDRCKGIPEPEYTMTYRQTMETPEEGECYCPHCGSPDTRELDNDDHDLDFKVLRRYFIPRKS